MSQCNDPEYDTDETSDDSEPEKYGPGRGEEEHDQGSQADEPGDKWRVAV